jgi:hypothetical protein
VFLGVDKKSKQKYALKVINLKSRTERWVTALSFALHIVASPIVSKIGRA